MKKIDYSEILKRTCLKDEQVLSVYMCGSRVYGNFTDRSDWDFILVTKSGPPSEQYSDNLININMFSKEAHQQRINEHEISALETLWLKPEQVLLERASYKFLLDKSKLRHALSAKSSNSWVKAKKKLTVEKDYNDTVGKKSMWHSMRIIHFGIQIANFGRIVDYGEFNHEYNNIMYCYDWEEMFETYKRSYNELLSKFREVAPK